MINGIEIKDPLIQITRSESLFRQLLHELKYTFAVEAQVIFINPAFYLYEAPIKAPFVFHAQLPRFLKKLGPGTSSKLSARHVRFVEKLAKLHLTENPYSRLPAYTYEELEKGIVCWRGCGCLDLEETNSHTLICKKCSFVETKESALLRSIEEFRLLFPKMRLTLDVIFNWCKVIKSKRTIQKVLSKHFDLVLFGRGSYYVDKVKK
ncbi:hypothetical protein V7138_05110 [Bacillus sp. JJ1533]|uniref:hypothetical protein n=1 Tax=Bacillus sp. JJ1533 TaxID=3122959 RepID=UPI0030006DBD